MSTKKAFMSQIQVTKYSGETQPYDESKLRQSLKSAGATQDTIDQIAKNISELLYDGISTQKIYAEAFRQLRQDSSRSAGRYKLKEALFELGPTGYPFEIFIGELLNRHGYETEVGVTMKGDCVPHEIDVVAKKDDEFLMVECKFHNRNQHHCNIKVPLYIHSRFLDIKGKWSQQPGHKFKVHRGFVATNTRFSSDAVTYASCVGLQLLSWDYPKREGIKELVRKYNLHPVTCLSSLSKDDKSLLLEKDVIFCRQIWEDKEILKSAGINPRRVNNIAKEAGEICNHQP